MSAVLKEEPRFEPMREQDLVAVLAIENAVYTHPWSRGNFLDSLRSGYECRLYCAGAELLGYFVLLPAAGEAHLLNLSVAAAHQRRGHGSALLEEVIRIARAHRSRTVFLEVRESNRPAQALYLRFGFRRIAVRRDYYPAAEGREDAIVLSFPL
jgi:ribosomal-protein-alanine N-acetyltransferase